MPFDAYNIELFQMINAPAHPAQWLLLMAKIFAEGVLYAVALWMIVAWTQGGRGLRFALLDGLFAAMTGLAVNQLIGLMIYHPRPFVMHLGHNFLAHGVDSSFPSDHAVLMFGISFGMLMSRAGQGWGWMIFLLALGVCWSRVYLGVHFPFDMAGAFIVALASAGVVRLLSPLLRGRLYPALSRLYDAVISALGLPESIFPRAGS